MNAADPIARLAHVAHRYGEVQALSDLRLALLAGQLVRLIGPDGVGKSTLMGLIAGAKRMQQGEIPCLGGDMPQGPGRNPCHDLSARENREFFGKLFRLNRAERRTRIGRLTRATGSLADLMAPERHRGRHLYAPAARRSACAGGRRPAAAGRGRRNRHPHAA